MAIELTPQQKAVVNDRGGTLLVSAAAGSGKTKVLIDRVLKYIGEGRNIDDFMLITFTKAAASELRGKMIASLSEILAEDPNQSHIHKQLNRVYMAQISTVHSFCAAILREFAHVLELPSDFRTLEDNEKKIMTDKAMQRMLDDAYTHRADDQIALALDTIGADKDDQKLSTLVYKVYESVQCWKDPKERILALQRGLERKESGDPLDTIWGSYHYEAMQEALAMHTDSIQKALRMVQLDPTLQPIDQTFAEDLELIEKLRSLRTWDELNQFAAVFSKLKSSKKPADAEMALRLKHLRTNIKDDVKARMEVYAISAEDIFEDLQVTSDSLCGLLKLVLRFQEEYQKEKRSHRALDFDDLEHEMLRLLIDKDGRPTAAAQQIGDRFFEIIVDEYQDTNAVQDAIFSTLAQRGNLFMVGDVKQSIYRFRMADPTCFLNRYNAYPLHDQAQEGEPRKILLSDNFRSYPEVLFAANDVFRLLMSKRIGGLRYGDDEALRTNKDPHAGEPIELHCIDTSQIDKELHLSNEEIEAEFVASRIEQMLYEKVTIQADGTTRPIHLEDIAILMRGVSKTAPIYMQALQRHSIRCVCDNDNILLTEEISVLVSLLNVIDNPYQDIPLLGILCSPLFRFSADDLAQVRTAKRGVPLFDALCYHSKGQQVREAIRSLRQTATQTSLVTLLDEIDEKLYLRAVYPNADQCFDKIQSLAKSYESTQRYGLSGFLRFLEIQKEHGIGAEGAGQKGAVRIMTMHKSKGLEFPVVFLCGLNKMFNSSDYTKEVLVDPVLGIGTKRYDPHTAVSYSTMARNAIADRIKKENRSEEMRILYVAMTRAKCRLIMTMSGKKLASRLKTIAKEMTLPPSEMMVGSALSMGEWLLVAAMTRTEAGELFAVCGPSEVSSATEYPWRITWTDGSGYLPKKTQEADRGVSYEPKLQFCELGYANAPATVQPSKVTATQLKGRSAEEDMTQTELHIGQLRFDEPCFDSQEKLTAAQRGTAIHLAMEQLCFERCTDIDSIEKELQRLVLQSRMSKLQAEAVPKEKILHFFQSDIGKKVLQAKHLVREFKFTILEDGAIIDPALNDEKVMLQGVADCCLIEEDGLIILDFKSDHIRKGAEEERAEHYRVQLDTYSRALSRIFEKPVKQRFLYFFETDCTYEI